MAGVGASAPANPACKIMTFRPTMEEFKDFNQYLVYMESQGAHRAGLAKVIPPKGWKPRRSYDDIDDFVIQAPIQQMVAGQSGLFTQYNIQKKPLTVQEFRRLANSDMYCTPRYLNYEDLERKYWKNLTFVSPIYGADVSGTLYDEDIEEWNIGHLNSILDVIEEDCGVSIQGVNTPYLYFGMWKTSFSWHTEDMDLYSINYLHFGEPKSWYAIPPEHGKRLERLAIGFFPNSFKSCEAFLRHKMTLISPSVLKKYSIPFDKITQEAGEFMITFPYGYHAGFNHGFNCAESTNFASIRWINYGKVATQCTCSKDMVKISMDPFVRRFQPDRYQAWTQGKDSCPLDHTLATPSTTPELQSWLQRRRRKAPSTSRYYEGRVSTNSNSTVQPGPESASDRSVTVDVTLNSEKTAESPNQALNCEPVSVTSAPSIHVTHSLRLNSTGAVLFSETDSQQAKIETEETVADILSESSIDYGTSALYKEQSSIRLDSALQGLETSENRTNAEIQNASFSEMPLLMPELIEERVNPQSLAPEMPSLTLKTAKSWRHPLRKPTARAVPSAVKQQAASDDETLEDCVTKEEEPETEEWAKPLAHLWQHRKANFQFEREYNTTAAKTSPHCAVCTLFMPYYQPDNLEERRHDVLSAATESQGSCSKEVGLRSRPLIPEICFAYQEGPCPLNTLLEEDGSSPLVACNSCCVQVHASCYGVATHEVSPVWTCDRCVSGDLAAGCCLCNLRGGALKRTSDDRWVHVMCAVGLPEVNFIDVVKRAPIDISAIPVQRYKLKCIYCRNRIKKLSGACIQCSCGRCPTSFHVTCAHAAGVPMEPDDWPYVVFITCHRHQVKVSKSELEVGQTVISKHKNLRYYSSRVTQVMAQTFYEVMFDDGSFSNDTFPEDIVSRDCAQLGPPEVGEAVQVKWPDGLFYGAKYLGSNTSYMYQVEFEDGSQVLAKREDIYTLDEDLPKKVKGRLSTASSMRFQDAFFTTQGERKRRRTPNSRFQTDYIAHISPRTFTRNSETCSKKCYK
uniref:[histone H3]-trimethyl-L-lysine(9) demethylase n=1 Tax=Cyprinus carpio TaxID=7962 RepID=A0A8C1R9Y1_CYPCA